MSGNRSLRRKRAGKANWVLPVFAVIAAVAVAAVVGVSLSDTPKGLEDGGSDIRTVTPFVPPSKSGVIDVTDFGAVGDGVSDDTKALQAAISEYVGTARILYFPPGTYLVSDTLEWKDVHGKWRPRLTLQGHSTSDTIIKLKDSAHGYSSPNRPKAVVYSASGLFVGSPSGGGKNYTGLGEGNEGFRNYIEDMTVDVGRRNPGAIGIDFLANNNGAIRNVEIRSGDGRGVAGISMSRKWVGPALLDSVAVRGFDVGIRTEGAEYSVTADNIVLTGQRVAGLVNEGMAISIRGLYSNNAATAAINGVGGLLVVVDAMLDGGSESVDAIENRGGMYIREVRANTAYRSLVPDIAGHAVRRYVSPRLKGSGFQDFSIATPDAPAPVTPGSEDWASVMDRRYAGGANPFDELDDTRAIQATLDSGRSTVYFPTSGEANHYLISETITVPRTVERIVGLQSTIAASGPRFAQANRLTPMLRIVGDTRRPLVIESLRVGAYKDPARGQYPLLHSSTRVLSAVSTTLSGMYGYVATDAAGDVFLSDYCCSTITMKNARLSAKQLNIESVGPKLKVDNGKVSILGLKVERSGPVIELSNRSEAEVLGGLLYPVEDVSDVEAAFLVRDSAISLSYLVSAYSRSANYPIQIRAVNSGDSVVVQREQLPARGRFGSVMPYYSLK